MTSPCFQMVRDPPEGSGVTKPRHCPSLNSTPFQSSAPPRRASSGAPDLRNNGTFRPRNSSSSSPRGLATDLMFAFCLPSTNYLCAPHAPHRSVIYPRRPILALYTQFSVSQPSAWYGSSGARRRTAFLGHSQQIMPIGRSADLIFGKAMASRQLGCKQWRNVRHHARAQAEINEVPTKYNGRSSLC